MCACASDVAPMQAPVLTPQHLAQALGAPLLCQSCPAPGGRGRDGDTGKWEGETGWEGRKVNPGKGVSGSLYPCSPVLSLQGKTVAVHWFRHFTQAHRHCLPFNMCCNRTPAFRTSSWAKGSLKLNSTSHQNDTDYQLFPSMGSSHKSVAQS